MYQKKQRKTNDEAQQIKSRAKEEADNLVETGIARLEELLNRRERLAMDRIKQAESSALDEIRLRTVNIALEATRYLLANNLTEPRANAILENAIQELPKKFN